MILFRASSGYKSHPSRQMPVSPDAFFILYFSANLFEDISAENNIYEQKTCTI
jgi:hypothetical protein